MAAHNDLGKWGEDLAVAYLQNKGYAIIERDWQSGHKDIDIIAFKDDTYVFVEVKTRGNESLGNPIEAIDEKKVRNLRTSINHYVKMRKIVLDFRLDVITILKKDDTDPDIQHIEDFRIW